METIMNIVIGIAEIALFAFIGFCAGRQYQMMKQTKQQMKDAEKLSEHAAKLLGIITASMAAIVATRTAESKDTSGETAETNESEDAND